MIMPKSQESTVVNHVISIFEVINTNNTFTIKW